MRLLVTGAAGFIGTNFVRQALAGTADRRSLERLVAVDLLTYAGNYANLRDLESDPRFRFCRADIADREAMARLVAEESVDTVVNFAAESHVDRSIVDHAPFVRTNVLGTLALLDAVRDRPGFRRFLHVSTDEVYGSVDRGRATEASPTRPSSPYAASKAAADGFVQAHATTYGVPAVITRCSNNYGPWQFPEKLIPLFVTNALDGVPLPLYGDGMNVRDWIYVHDHCAALWHVLGLEVGGGEVFNVSAENEVPNRTVTDLILAQLGQPASLVRYVADRPGHDRRYALDSTKLRATGWRPRHDFDAGLAATIAWYREHRAWWEAVKSGAYRDYYDRMYGARLAASTAAPARPGRGG
ncbi:MAG TPA: dTDP-glucose 4,6-dehydratase [Candidatus Binatia bacterium]|jgi:dTDP-glucose 4,6-dehydratase|nr:dTDP-glucose 4,6-dehydratase [Candidatus Binatia bacterium]